MSDANAFQRHDTPPPRPPGITPGDALHALPLHAPPRSAWPALAAELTAAAPATRSRPRRRAARWLALAAAVLVMLAVPLWQVRDAGIGMSAPADIALQVPTSVRPADGSVTAHGDPSAATPAAPTAADFEALLQESAQLEAWIAWSGTAGSESGVGVSMAMDVSDRIADIDALLARPALDPSAQWPLLQERLMRLRQLAGLHNTRQLLAANGADTDTGPVVVF